MRKVKVQKDSMPIGNKPSLSPDTGLRTPHSWVGFMAEGKFIIVGWLGDQLSTCTYSCHQSPLCFPCDSFVSGTIATGLGCAHAEVPLQTEFKAPLALGWIRRHFLFCCLPADPGLAKTGRNFPPGHASSRELLLECVQVGNLSCESEAWIIAQVSQKELKSSLKSDRPRGPGRSAVARKK